MVAYLFLCLRRQAGLSAVSSLTAAGLSILRPVLLRLAENPPALPGRVWGGLRGAGGHGEPAWPGLCRTPVSPCSLVQNPERHSAAPAGRQRPGCQVQLAHAAPRALCPPRPLVVSQSPVLLSSSHPVWASKSEPRTHPGPCGIGPLPAGHCSLLAHLVPVLTCVCSSRMAPRDDGGGSQPCRGSGLALGGAALVPAARPLCSRRGQTGAVLPALLGPRGGSGVGRTCRSWSV